MSKKLIIILVLAGLIMGAKTYASDSFSNGTLIKGIGPEVYVLEHGLRRWIASPTVFKNLSYDWGKIRGVSDDVLKSYPVGSKVDRDFSDGSLIKFDKSPKVYLYDNGKLRWIPDPNVFVSNNFLWENIIVIPSQAEKYYKTKGADVKSWEFLSLPTSFITAKPPEEVDFTRVVFSYSGNNPSGPVSDMTWQTFLDGYDTVWQGPTSVFTRAFDLPPANKTYTFYVRSRNKDGKIDSRPASFTFKTKGFSSLYKQLRITGIKNKGINGTDEYVKITNLSKTNFNVTGVILKNQRNETQVIPGAFEKLYLTGSGGYGSDIILEPNRSVVVFSGSSPVGNNFRLNKCLGYLNYYYSLPTKFAAECPKPFDQELLGLSKSCRDYIKTLGACVPPNTTDLKITADKQCTDYLLGTFNYGNCVSRYQVDPDFLKNDWYVYFNRAAGYLSDSHDEIKLLDKDNNIMDIYAY